MVIQTTMSTDVFCARLEALALEWRESRLPREWMDRGVYEFELQREGDCRYRLDVPMPMGRRFRCSTSVEVVSASGGAAVRFHSEMKPGFGRVLLTLAVPLFGLLLIAGVPGGFLGVVAASLAVFVAASLVTVIAITELPPLVAGVHSLLCSAAGVALERSAAVAPQTGHR